MICTQRRSDGGRKAAVLRHNDSLHCRASIYLSPCRQLFTYFTGEQIQLRCYRHSALYSTVSLDTSRGWRIHRAAAAAAVAAAAAAAAVATSADRMFEMFCYVLARHVVSLYLRRIDCERDCRLPPLAGRQFRASVTCRQTVVPTDRR